MALAAALIIFMALHGVVGWINQEFPYAPHDYLPWARSYEHTLAYDLLVISFAAIFVGGVAGLPRPNPALRKVARNVLPHGRAAGGITLLGLVVLALFTNWVGEHTAIGMQFSDLPLVRTMSTHTKTELAMGLTIALVLTSIYFVLAAWRRAQLRDDEIKRQHLELKSVLDRRRQGAAVPLPDPDQDSDVGP